MAIIYTFQLREGSVWCYLFCILENNVTYTYNGGVMYDTLKIKKIEKYDYLIIENKLKVFNNIKLLTLFSLLIFLALKNGLESEIEELIMGSSVIFGTINLTSMVKTICNIYKLNETKERLKNEDRQK